MGVRRGVSEVGGEDVLDLLRCVRNMGRRRTAVGMSNAHIVGSHGLTEAESRGIVMISIYKLDDSN